MDAGREADLVAAARAGDHAAWAELVRAHAAGLAAYLGARLRRPEVVDGLVVEAVVSGWASLPAMPAGEAFDTWFRRIGGAIAMRWAREHPGEAIEGLPDPARLPAEHAEAITELDRRVGALPENERMALELRWRGGLSGDALGAALRLPAEQAEALADRAEAALGVGWPPG